MRKAPNSELNVAYSTLNLYSADRIQPVQRSVGIKEPKLCCLLEWMQPCLNLFFWAMQENPSSTVNYAVF
ncbi:MAG TPA: hypothetical protein VK689_21005, partial [Armatimonadota bacterium]|nr:hypothetical protein [Armatimonadota bacterium]